MKKIVAAAIAACVLSAAPAFAQDSKALAAAHGAAQRWLKLLDKQDYAGAWDASASEVRANTPKLAWNMLLSATHLPLGQFRTRRLKSTAPEAGGKRVSFAFDSQFEKNDKVSEKVTTVLDKDGAWRVTGYSVSAD